MTILYLLRHLKTSVTKNSNLLIAEGVLMFLLGQLETQNTDISKRMLENFTKRFEERINKKLISRLFFMNSGKYPLNNKYFSYSSKYIIKTTAKEMYTRIFPGENAPTVNVVSSDTEKSEMQKAIDLILI